MSLKSIWRSFRWYIKSARISISSGWHDLFTVQRWALWARFGLAVVGLVGAVTAFTWGVGGEPEDEPAGAAQQLPVLPKAQLEAYCRQGAAESQRIAREFEEQTGEDAQGYSKERCDDAMAPPAQVATSPPASRRTGGAPR
jgi:hypothetical protein